MTKFFVSPHDQFAERNNQKCEIIGKIDEPDDTHDAEVLPMYRIRFADGEEIEAWPEELYDHSIECGPYGKDKV